MRLPMNLLLAIVTSAGLLSCSSGSGDSFVTDVSAQTTIRGGAATTLAVNGNTFSVTFPQNCFNRDTIAMVASDLSVLVAGSANSEYLQYYPTASKAVGDLITGIVINTPADRSFNRDIQLRMTFYESASHTPGDQYIIYRFDFDNLVWNRWGDIVAVVDGGGRTASATLPTTGLRGFIGPLALFKDMRRDNQPAYVPSTLSGTVVDSSGNPLATDIGIYFYVGTVQFPVNLPASSGARIPSGGTFRNTIDSAADGSFTVTLPDILVGHQLNLEFGREDPNRTARKRFDILPPVSQYAEARELSDIEVLTLRYGPNNVRSRGVDAGTGAEAAIVIPDELL